MAPDAHELRANQIPTRPINYSHLMSRHAVTVSQFCTLISCSNLTRAHFTSRHARACPRILYIGTRLPSWHALRRTLETTCR